MSRALAALLVAVVVAGAPPGHAQGGRGFARDARQQPTGSAVIRGRIVTADAGTPIRRAQVRAFSADTRASRLASSDAQGRFELRDLPAGRWELTASKAGFVTLRYGQRRPFEAGRPLELRDGQVLEGAEIALPRGAAITGRVFDEFGDAVAGARVQVLRYQFAQGTRRLTPTGIGDQSDDTGAFRLYGLTPGEYYVSATLRALPVDDPTTEAAGYAPTYYPGTANVAEAQRITIGVGQEAGNISFALLPVRTVRVSGSVIDSTGQPLDGGVVRLAPADVGGDQPLQFGGGGNVRPGGSFTLTNVAPGSYTLIAGGRGRGRRGGGGGGDEGEIAVMPLTVGTEDIAGLYVVTTKGAALSGTVVAAGSGAPLPAGIQITAQPVPAGRGILVRQARVESNGSFTVTGLLGPRILRVTGLPQDWMLDAITLDGADVTDRVLEFSGSQDLRGARVTVTDRVTEVRGSVAAGAQPARDYTVVIFPDDETKWTFPSRYVRAARPDQQAAFRVRGLPPDERYLAVAVDYIEEGEGGDPQFLAQVRDRATRFALGPGESKAIELKLVAR